MLTITGWKYATHSREQLGSRTALLPYFCIKKKKLKNPLTSVAPMRTESVVTDSWLSPLPPFKRKVQITNRLRAATWSPAVRHFNLMLFIKTSYIEWHIKYVLFPFSCITHKKNTKYQPPHAAPGTNCPPCCLLWVGNHETEAGRYYYFLTSQGAVVITFYDL